MPSQEKIPDLNIFMLCPELNRKALRPMPEGLHWRHPRENELDIWMEMQADDPQYLPFLREYFDKAYAPHGDLFFRRCLFVCDAEDRPIGSCFAWKAYDAFYTIHWLKVAEVHENRGIGRALLSRVLEELSPGDFPVYLHTHPSCYRAVKLYSDFGFRLIRGDVAGRRKNDLAEALPYLERHMPPEDFARLQYAEAPDSFCRILESAATDEF